MESGGEPGGVRADHGLMAVDIGPGETHVRLRFFPTTFWIGVGISAASLGLAIWLGIHRRRDVSAAPPAG